jgi:hypothetical protein
MYLYEPFSLFWGGDLSPEAFQNILDIPCNEELHNQYCLPDITGTNKSRKNKPIMDICVSRPSVCRGNRKIIFLSRGTSNYKNIYKPEKGDSGKSNSPKENKEAVGSSARRLLHY